MFETSIVRSEAVASRRRYSLLSVSLVAHSAAIIGAVAVSVATVEFPSEAPDQFELLRPVAAMVVPPPLGTPEGNDKPKAEPQQKVVTPPPVQPAQQTAPSVVPDAPPQAAVGPQTPGATDPNAEPGTGPRGVQDGDPKSVLKDFDLPLTTTPSVEDKVYAVTGDVKAPRVIRRVEPRYPQFLIRTGKTAVVTVRCIVDKNGAVRDIGLVYSSFPAFNDVVIDAMQQWRFEPGSLNGRAVDTVFELTVKFSVSR